MTNGLSHTEAAERLKTFGFNELPSAKPKNIWRIASEVVKEPMFLLLISCGALYMILGDYREGAILLLAIFIIIFITFYQYRKTEKALESLRKLASPRVLVIREGKEQRIAGRELVPDDLIILNEGDRIPADARLLSGLNITVDESILTGESVPVSKSAEVTTDAQDRVFSGTLVVRGKGRAVVLSTGLNTQFGKIGSSLEKIEQGQTRLQKEMKVLIKKLFLAGIVISIAVVTAFYVTRGNFIQSLLNGLAASMAILPEEFPVVLTVFLALGAWRLSKQQVLTKKPAAIETLGSATVLCSDKTGTITQNKMDVAALYCNNKVLDRNKFDAHKEELHHLITTAFYASQKDSIDPMEQAIGATCQYLAVGNTAPANLIREYPLSKEFFAMTRVVQGYGNSLDVYSKGAPEAIFALCNMREQELAPHMKVVHDLAKKGHRVIAAAHAVWHQPTLPETQHGFNFTFAGLLGFEDPIRAEVPGAIKECYEAGIKVIMITGDFPATAASIASQIGLQSGDHILTGTELQHMNEEQLKEQIKTVSVFARIIPEQKLQIIQALKANGEVVAMTGDGVNDAPALKAADIGVAMGNRGTDVAREASALVLLDDNFASIVSAIRSGRKIYDNLQKAMSYILAIHIPIIGLTLLPAFFTSFPLLLMPLHIVFMELIIDPVCSIAFESEKEEEGIMKRLPRDPDMRFFGGRKIALSLLKGLLLLGMVVCIYFLSIHEGHTEGEIRAITFSALIIGNIFLILTSLSETRSFIAVIRGKNTAVMVIILVACALLFLILLVPQLQGIFSFQFPGFYHFIPSVTGAFLMLCVLESVRFFKKRRMLTA